MKRLLLDIDGPLTLVKSFFGHKWTCNNVVVGLVTCCWLLLLCLAGICHGEVYTSTAQLEDILRVEHEVVSVLDDYVHRAELKLKKIKNYIRDYEMMVSEEGETWIAGNPLHAYKLMKRLAIDWIQVESAMKDGDWWNSLNDIKQRRSYLTMPVEEDLLGAAMALIRLKQTYKLNVTDLSRGILQGISTATQLTARDCLYLGRNTMSAGSSGQAVEWLEEAMSLAGQEQNKTASQAEILPFLQEAMIMYDTDQENQGRKTHSGPSYFETSSKSNYEAGGTFDLLTEDNLSHGTPANLQTNTYRSDEKRFEALCRGEKLRLPGYEATLKCYYRTGPHSYFRLRKVKVEENHMHPPVLTFHDVIYDNEIKLIQMLAGPHLQRSTVVGTNGASRLVSDVRTSQNTWIHEFTVLEQPILQRLQDRIEWLTNLHVSGYEEAEALQVANYGVGGHYNPHFDYLLQDKTPEELEAFDENHVKHGDRIATFMFYLSDVARGGATAFPKLGVTIWPRKGSAAFWYNLKRNGNGDTMTLHGACPVLHGSKWVGNKWIKERAQLFTCPCGLSSDE